MRILVTGGAGYIGSHMVKMLGERGYNVLTYDNLSSGHKEAVLYGELVVGDLADKDLLRTVFSSFRPEAVIHFAASIVVPESIEKPLLYYRNNVCNTLNLLEVVKEFGVRYFIFSSSAAVYGIPKEVPVTETAPLVPINPYGYTKVVDEKMLEDMAAAEPDFCYVSLRYFNVTGADPEGKIGQVSKQPTHLILRALKAAKGELERLEIYGTDYPTKDGTCIRDYIYVNDLVEAHILALNYLCEGNKSDVFNCGYGHGYSVREVIAAVKKVTGRDFEVREAARRPGDPPVLIADNHKILEKLNWQPKHNDLEFMVETAWRWELNRRF
jgi:UDP-glucose 4-epimerase